MNPEWFGDSFDIVKRFFIDQLNSMGYHVSIDPLFTGVWNDIEMDFFRFLKTSTSYSNNENRRKSALFLDPDTGIGKKKSKKHITIEIMADHLNNHAIVFSFDQSFSYSRKASDQMNDKLNHLKATGNFGFYYDSHAHFLFAAGSNQPLQELEQQLLSTGLPKKRLFRGSHT